MIPWTEEQIERSVERSIDKLDRSFMTGKIGQLEYDVRMKAIKDWADAEYASLARKASNR